MMMHGTANVKHVISFVFYFNIIFVRTR